MGFSFKRRAQVTEGAVDDDAITTGIEVGGEVVNPDADLKKFKKLHKWDPFLDVDRLDAVDDVIESGDIEKQAAVEETLLVEDSPYAEVRSSVCSSRYQTRRSIHLTASSGQPYRRSGHAHQYYPSLDYRWCHVHCRGSMQHSSRLTILTHHHHRDRRTTSLIPVRLQLYVQFLEC